MDKPEVKLLMQKELFYYGDFARIDGIWYTKHEDKYTKIVNQNYADFLESQFKQLVNKNNAYTSKPNYFYQLIMHPIFLLITTNILVFVLLLIGLLKGNM